MVVDVPNEAVAEFSQKQGQVSAEFGRSTGGQFNTVVKSGSNDIHGSPYEYFANRRLNAIDEASKRRGIAENARLDDNRFGGALGGPVIRNRLFHFGNDWRNPVGFAAAPGRPSSSPTVEGFAALDRFRGITQTSLEVLKLYVPAAPEAQRSTSVLGTEVPVGVLPINVPAWQANSPALAGADYTRETGDQSRIRFIRNSTVAIDPGTVPDPPTLTTESEDHRHPVSASCFRTISPAQFSKTRLAYTRSASNLPAGDFDFPGLDSFLETSVEQDLDIQIGPPSRPSVGNPEHRPGRQEPDPPAGSQHLEVRRRRRPQHHVGGLHPEAAGRLQLLDARALPAGSEPGHPGGTQHRTNRLRREQQQVLRLRQGRDQDPEESHAHPGAPGTTTRACRTGTRRRRGPIQPDAEEIRTAIASRDAKRSSWERSQSERKEAMRSDTFAPESCVTCLKSNFEPERAWARGLAPHQAARPAPIAAQCPNPYYDKRLALGGSLCQLTLCCKRPQSWGKLRKARTAAPVWRYSSGRAHGTPRRSGEVEPSGAMTTGPSRGMRDSSGSR